MTEDFIVVATAEEAVDRLAALHERATKALSQALKRYLKDRLEPTAEERAQFRYPELRLTYRINGEVPTTTRAYAKVQLPGTYSVTVTHPAAFRKYLLEQLKPLMAEFIKPGMPLAMRGAQSLGWFIFGELATTAFSAWHWIHTLLNTDSPVRWPAGTPSPMVTTPCGLMRVSTAVPVISSTSAK